MVIKVWNNYDMGVFRVHPDIKKMAEKTKEIFNPEELKELRKIAREFMEELGLEFVHNLTAGWERKILANGKVLTKSGRQELKTADEIKKAISENGEIQFLAHKKNSSLRFISSIKKPAEKCWS